MELFIRALANLDGPKVFIAIPMPLILPRSGTTHAHGRG